MSASIHGLFPEMGEQQSHDPGGKVRIRIPARWKSDAVFSECGRYRYMLSRVWDDESRGICMWLAMNPSTADISHNDPTIAKCCRFSQRWGFSGLYIANTCAYRATDNRNLLKVQDPVGAENIEWILRMARSSHRIIVCHGILPKGLQKHADSACSALLDAGHALYALRLSNSGVPWHPLYVPESTEPVVWRYA